VYSPARPNRPEEPNISLKPKNSTGASTAPSPAAIDAVVGRYELLMQRLIGGHAPEFTEVGVTMAQAKVLYVVMAARELRLSELAGRLGIGSSSASELVERLVELGFLHRHDDPTDRRQVVITATPDAAALLERFRELNERQLRLLLAALDPDELGAVERAIEVLGRAIDRTTITPVQGGHP
jgi:DNA-binding MarR family transcriptional regulator